MPSLKPRTFKRLFVATGILVLVIGGLRLFVGPVYLLEDGCRCGRERQWYAFDECRALRHTRFFLKVTSDGDPKHQHRYWDATCRKVL
jgi:hypothetical protein